MERLRSDEIYKHVKGNVKETTPSAYKKENKTKDLTTSALFSALENVSKIFGSSMFL